MISPVGSTRALHRRNSAATSPPMPMLVSISSAVPQRPSAGSRSSTRRCSAGPPRLRLVATATADMSTPQRGPAGPAERDHHPTRPAPEVDDRRSAARHHHQVDVVGLTAPPLQVQAEHVGRRRDGGGPHRRRHDRTGAQPTARSAARRATPDTGRRSRARDGGWPRRRRRWGGRRHEAGSAAGPTSRGRATGPAKRRRYARSASALPRKPGRGRPRAARWPRIRPPCSAPGQRRRRASRRRAARGSPAGC